MDWWALVNQTKARTTHLADTVHQDTNHMGFCNASGIGVENMWPNPTKLVTSIIWPHPGPSNITDALVLENNIGEMLTNYDLKLNTPVIHEDTILAEFPEVSIVASHSVPYNTNTVAWSMREQFNINRVVVDLLHIRVLHSRQLFLEPSVFYHTGQDNIKDEDASFLFNLPDNPFLSHVYST